MAWVVDALKVSPEHASLPDVLVDASPQQLAEARSRLQQISQVATELRKIVDAELAVYLQGGAMRYGDQIIRPSTNGRPTVVDPEGWWSMVADAVVGRSIPAAAALLAALYPANAVRLTGLSRLADEYNYDLAALRSTFIEYDPPTSSLSVMPISKAPKWAQKLEEGQLSNQRVDE
jgi:hypothetical protein